MPAQKPENPPRGVEAGEGSREQADFSGASPVASALGIRSGATPRGKGNYNSTSEVASSSTVSSTAANLRSAAKRNAADARRLTLRGIPLVA